MRSNKIIQRIKKSKKILISTHVNPDPDALCSELAVAAFLGSLGKKFSIINDEKLLERYEFLPGAKQIKNYSAVKEDGFDVAIIVDCGELSRIGRVQGLIGRQTVVINIDHHITNDRFGHINLIHPQASSTTEVLFGFLKGAQCPFDKNLAMNLYTGIMTDTGSFRYENTTAMTHMIASELLKFKFSANELYRKIYEIIPLSDMKEFTKVISRLESLVHGQVVCVELGKKVIARFSEEFDLRDAIFKFLRCITGVEIFIILTEINSRKTRINLRSSGKVNVAQLARMFEGGGHRRASGCMIPESISKAKMILLKQIKIVL